jgi:hypothetical protein
MMGKEYSGLTPTNAQKDRTLECAVCGKQFNRGHLDLTRHINAITLQHYFTKEPSPEFPFGCSRCGIYFTNQDHLEAHNIHTTCGKSKGEKQIKSFIEDLQMPTLKGRTMPDTAITPSITAGSDAARKVRSSSESKQSPPNIEAFGLEPVLLLSDIKADPQFPSSESKQTYTPTVNFTPRIDEGFPRNNETPAMHIPPLIIPPRSRETSVDMTNSLDPKFDVVFPESQFQFPAPSSVTPHVLPKPEQPLMNTFQASGEMKIDTSLDPLPFPLSSPESPIDPSNPAFLPRRHDAKTMECMVCGKLFPRGPIDLHRHATGNLLLRIQFYFLLFIFLFILVAVTLKHLVSKKRNPAFNFGCERCGLFFTCEEHLKLHDSYTTCNPAIVWPQNADSTSGLRTIHISQYQSTPPTPLNHKSATNSPYLTKRKESFSSSSVKSSETQRLLHDIESSNMLSLRKKRQGVSIDCYNLRQKRTRMILPDGKHSSV